ncbi:MAG: efflux RND transporter periplasmic adaptor subunit [Candidatus Sumerlaeaceae bacterium]|nr:efflux RND transporter periplasmic adaptor subunit [Candidatus Sumerlaeaceae bacterium]
MAKKDNVLSRAIGTVSVIGMVIVLAGNACELRQPHLPTHVSGTVECDETKVASRYGGRVVRVLRHEGDILPPSSVIVELEAPELEARLAQARAARDEAVAGPRPEEIASAKAEWEAVAAELSYAQTDAQRLRQLYQQGTAAKAELDAAESKAAYLEQSANAARKRYELLTAGTRAERIAQAQAHVEELEALQKELRVLSPATTTILEVLGVRLGDVVAAHQAMATVTFPDSLYVRFYVPALWLEKVRVGDTITVTPDATPERSVTGVIEHVARVPEFTPRNVQTAADRIDQVYGVKVRLPAESGIRAGMTVVGRFEGMPQAPSEYRRSGRMRQR